MRTALLLISGFILVPSLATAQQETPSKPGQNAGTTQEASKPVTLTGQINTHFLGKPTLTASDGKKYDMVGSEIARLESTKDIDGKQVELTGKLIDDGKTVDVESFKLLGQDMKGASAQPTAPPAQSDTGLTNPPQQNKPSGSDTGLPKEGGMSNPR